MDRYLDLTWPTTSDYRRGHHGCRCCRATTCGDTTHVQSVLTATADAQHEMTRLPFKFDRMSDSDEIDLGNRLAESYSDRWNSDLKDANKNHAIEAYLQIIGDRAAAGARRKLPYKFHYIPSRGFVNAFALPGGHVFVGEGLLALMKTEDALVAVLGHEVEHIDLRHSERGNMHPGRRNLTSKGRRKLYGQSGIQL